VTGELKDPIEVNVTVWVPEPPAPTLRVGEASETEKSAPEVIVSPKEVVCVPDDPVPLIVIGKVPVGAAAATFTVNAEGAFPPEGIEIGFGLNVEKVTPLGTDPVTDKVTDPEKLNSEFPTTVTPVEPPCGIEIVGVVTLRLKSAVVGVSSPTLFVPLSRNQMFPDASAATSCGWLPLPVGHSVN
jgi:hypothetical protein